MLSPRLRWKLSRYWAQFKEGLRGSRSSAPKPRVCFNCGRLVGATEKVCSHCGTSQSAVSFSAFKRVSLAVVPAENPLTFVLLFANLVLLILSIFLSQRLSGGANLFDVDGRVLVLLGAKYSPLIYQYGEYWRLVMPIFLHGGLLHFGFNSFVLWQIGPQVEELFGPARFLYLYLTTGVIGFVASAWWSPMSISIGASGALMGLIGVLISHLSQRPGFATEYRSQLIRWAIFVIVLGLLPLGLDNAAHLGGLLSGLVLGRLISSHRPVTSLDRWLVNVMGWGSAFIIFWSVVMVLLHVPAAQGS